MLLQSIKQYNPRRLMMSNPENDPTHEEKERMLREQPQHAMVSCEVCLKEIPKSLAHIEEAEDYVLYFCGLDCFDKWEHQNNTNNT